MSSHSKTNFVNFLAKFIRRVFQFSALGFPNKRAKILIAAGKKIPGRILDYFIFRRINLKIVNGPLISEFLTV